MSGAPPRIAFVVAGLGAGGAERVIALLASHWTAAGREVAVIAFDCPGEPVYHAFHPAVRLIRLGGPRGGALATARRIAALRRALRDLAPTLVLSFLTKINVLTLAATLGTPVPVVAAERNNPRRQPMHPAWRRALALLYPRAAAIVLQTEASRAVLPPGVAGRAVVIPNPIVAPRLAAATPPRMVAGVGRLEPQKGFDRLIDAFAAVADRHPDWRLAIWGEGPLRAELQARIDACGLAGRASLMGLSVTPGGWIGEAGLFALASRYEGFPNALGEAMAAGLPVIAFDCEFGPRELIRPGVDGVLVRDGDEAAFTAALDQLLGDGARRLELGNAARGGVERFGFAHVEHEWNRLVSLLTRNVEPQT